MTEAASSNAGAADVILIPQAIAGLVRDAGAARGCASRLVEVGPERSTPPGAEGAVALFRYRIAQADLMALVASLPLLRWIHTASSGVDQFYSPAIAARHIVVTTSRGAHSAPIAEHVMALLLALAKNLPAHIEAQRRRSWHKVDGEDLGGKTVGVVGLGSIGRAVASRARAFGMRVIGIRHSGLPVPDADAVWGPDGLGCLLEASDAVVIAAPLTAQTEAVIDEAALRHMKPTAWLINVARGGLIDEAALARALHEGWIAGAALDVFRTEPLPPDHPLYECPRLLMTSHVSALTPLLDRRMAALFAENLWRFEHGEPLLNVHAPDVVP